jgi:hypothetical protein
VYNIFCINSRRIKKQGRESGGGSSEGQYSLRRADRKYHQKQCPHVLIVKVGWRKGKVLGSEDGTAMEMDFVMSRGEKLSRVFLVLNRNFDVIFGKTSLG